MMLIRCWRTAALAAPVAALGLGGCSMAPRYSALVEAETKPVATAERDCLMRAMYFESNRSSEEGLLAVGTVVMNRVESGRYANTICGVVGEPGQFAAGALTKRLSERESGLAQKVADEVVAGKRHSGMQNVMFFHQAGLHFPYHNMHYVLVAG